MIDAQDVLFECMSIEKWEEVVDRVSKDALLQERPGYAKAVTDKLREDVKTELAKWGWKFAVLDRLVALRNDTLRDVLFLGREDDLETFMGYARDALELQVVSITIENIAKNIEAAVNPNTKGWNAEFNQTIGSAVALDELELPEYERLGQYTEIFFTAPNLALSGIRDGKEKGIGKVLAALDPSPESPVLVRWQKGILEQYLKLRERRFDHSGGGVDIVFLPTSVYGIYAQYEYRQNSTQPLLPILSLVVKN